MVSSLGLPNHYALCPEDVGYDGVPFRFIVLASAHDGLSDVVMLPFHKAIRLLVICGDFDMSDSVLCHQVFHCLNKHRSIVSDDFCDASPSTQNLLEDKHA
jgi:hypothetical protein